MSVENVLMVEVVESEFYVPTVTRILMEFFGKEPRRTRNASECVARGTECFDVSEFHVPAKIRTYMIGPFHSTKGDKAKVKIKMRLNLHGIVSVESATCLEEEETEVLVVKEPTEETSKMQMKSLLKWWIAAPVLM